MIKRWVEYSRGYRSIELHSVVWGYETRGKWGRELRVDSAKMNILNHMRWMTKRYNR
jgi:hypothetical protein